MSLTSSAAYNRAVREVILRVPRLAVEDILDRLLPLVPSGVREVPSGRHMELRMRGPDVPPKAEIDAAAGRWPHKLSEREVPDDWRRRRLADYEPLLIADRVVVRPDWAPPTNGMIDIVLRESSAFGVGRHPTTRTCLEVLLELEPEGAFADLGCGTGVLAILAARLGWAPVAAIDVLAGSVEATRENAELNGVEVDAQVLDLTEQAPPPADVFAANVPSAIHAALASRWKGRACRAGVVSGFGPSEADGVLGAYAARGLHQGRRIDAHDWSVILLERS